MRTELFTKTTESFIETGSYEGDGIDLAIRSGFTKIFSIEIQPHRYEACVERFKNNPEVSLILGDSYFELEKLLKDNPSERFTYWLDGHYSGPHTGIGVKSTPILKELEVILKRDVSGEIIYIDDMRIYKAFDEEVNTDSIINTIFKHKPHAEISYEASPHDANDILCVKY